MSDNDTKRYRETVERGDSQDLDFRRYERTSFIPLSPPVEVWCVWDSGDSIEDFISGPHLCYAIATSYTEYSYSPGTAVEVSLNEEKNWRHREYRPGQQPVSDEVYDPDLIYALTHYFVPTVPAVGFSSPWLAAKSIAFSQKDARELASERFEAAKKMRPA